MIMYWRELTVPWGESDPFGLVYFPRMLAWFNDTEHELFRTIGYPIEKQIKNDQTTFVMGEIHFRFVGPAAYGERVRCVISLKEMRKHSLHWHFKATNAQTGAEITEGKATRIYARINKDGTLSSAPIPAHFREALTQQGDLAHLPDEDRIDN